MVAQSPEPGACVKNKCSTELKKNYNIKLHYNMNIFRGISKIKKKS